MRLSIKPQRIQASELVNHQIVKWLSPEAGSKAGGQKKWEDADPKLWSVSKEVNVLKETT